MGGGPASKKKEKKKKEKIKRKKAQEISHTCMDFPQPGLLTLSLLLAQDGPGCVPPHGSSWLDLEQISPLEKA